MKNTIKRHSHFSFVMRCGTKIVLPACICYVLPIKLLAEEFKSYTEKEFVYGIMSSKKTIGNAVERNAVKRKFRLIVSQLNLKDYAIVIYARSLSKKMIFEKTLEQIKKAMQ